MNQQTNTNKYCASKQNHENAKFDGNQQNYQKTFSSLWQMMEANQAWF